MQNIHIFQKLTFILSIKILLQNKNECIFFVRKNIVSKFFKFFNIKRIQQLEWDLIELNDKQKKKTITRIIENQEVANFVYGYLNSINNLHSIEKNFYHYLVKYYSNHKVIGDFSIENIIIFFEACDFIFKNKKKYFYINNSELNNFIKIKYSSIDNIINFTNKCPINIFFSYFNIFKKFIFVFNFRSKKKSDKKLWAVMDSFEINEPSKFFSIKKYYDKIIYLTFQKNIKFEGLIFIYNFVSISIIFKTLKVFFSKNYFKRNKTLNYLYLNYYFDKLVFKKIFKFYNIKKFITAYIPQVFSSSAVAAIHEINGKSFGFTMSFCEEYSSHQNIDAYDFFISFNNSNYKKQTISNLKKIYELGYIHDYKFENKRIDSKKLKETLNQNSAEYIIGFFDQGHSADKLFEISYEVAREGYNFLLNKVISNKIVGLIIKPKKPKFLKEKLGDVYNLLIKAKQTGRVIVLDDHPVYHSKNFEDIPAKVAFASNITIHDTLLAGTAGLESALSGCKSVYFDYYKSSKSQFYKDNLKIAFNDWDVLWDNIESDMNNKNPQLGNWENIINRFDSFQDGKSNLRIMNFIENN